ncbi:AAA family ATPase [Yersinia intermedia]|uniref:AAA family ATPase n=1 Tax=Yersinia intermedia TaxID=631 RepID=UPI00093EA186
MKYLAPIRANTERYYRFQDLQVNEMDHTGSNLAMMLNSFTKKEKLEFTKWTEENFGFSIIIEKHSEHYAIYVKNENDDLKYNISDMGFGYSQVLPIILSIWIEAERKSSRRQPSIFIIEQPELHLHPAYQHKLANLFARVIKKAKDNQSNIKIIFETHSQTMINALGICVEDEDIGLDKNDISIIIFDKNNEEGTTIEVATFNNEGYLNNWPAGFFSGRS